MRKKQYLTAFAVLLALMLALTGCSRRPSKEIHSRETDPVPTVQDGRTEHRGREMETEEIAEYLSSRVVKVETDTGVGSGFFIDDQGTIVTNFHVINQAEMLSVVMNDGAKYDVDKVVDFDPYRDVAVLKIPMEGNDYLRPCTEYRQGASVYAYGSPRNEDASFTSGTLSSTNRQMGMMECIQIDAAINPGNSGGPVVNKWGEVLGINSYTIQDADGMSYAIKIDLLDQLSMDKNYSMNRYREWCNKEVGRSYMATSDGMDFYNTFVHTYTNETGVECYARTDDFEVIEEGYAIMYLWYFYDYMPDDYDKYCDYLSRIGFEYSGAIREMGLEGAVYHNVTEGFDINLLIDTEDNVLLISCPVW